MVAVFTGLGAGFERGSAAQIGAGGLLGSSSQGRVGEGVFLNAATGNLVLSRQDEFLVGRGPDLAITRTYNSLGALDDNGDQWRQSTDRRVYGLTGTVNTTGSTIKRVSADGSEITYSWNGSYYATTEGAGAHDKLTYSSGLWTWTDGSSQITETYGVVSSYGQTTGSGASTVYYIAKQTDLDTNSVTFVYTSGKLTRVATANDTTGQQSAVEYGWTGANLTSVVTKYTDYSSGSPVEKTLTRTAYAYDTSDRLITVTTDLTPANTSDSATYTTTYTYDGTSKRVATITQTDGSSLAITYDGSNRVSTLVQTVGTSDTRTTSIAYYSDRTEITDPRGQVTKLYFDSAGQLTKVIAPPAYTGATAQQVQYAYDSAGNLTSVTDAGGGVTSYQYDSSGNVTQITDPLSHVVMRSYASNNSLLVETRTASVAGASPSSVYTRYVYDSENHLRYTISAEGHVTEYRYHASGDIAVTLEYPSHPYASGSSAPSESAMDTWRNGLSDRSSVKAVYYGYDARGNLVQRFAVTGAATDGVADVYAGYGYTNYVYDQMGLLLSRQTGGEAQETFLYDGLGRLTGSTDLAGGTTTIVFADASLTTTVTTSTSHTIVSTYNKAGELISRVDSGTQTTGGTVSYLYDKNGQVRRVTDATGNKSYILYDKTGRKIADIGHNGELVEYRYDQTGRLVATARYNTLVASSHLTTLDDPTSELEVATIRPTASSADIWQWHVYDADGRIIQDIQGDGSLTKYEYDASDRLIATYAYFNKLTVTSFITTPPSTAQSVTAHAKDAVMRTFYDSDGRVIGALNGEGGLSQIFYDAAGQKVREVAYANLTNSAYRASGTFADLLTALADPTKDVWVRYVYDGQGQLRFTIDALNRVNELVYHTDTAYWFDTGLVRKTISYAAPLGSLSSYDYATVKTAVAALASGANDRASFNVYNTRRQLVYTVDATGAAVGYTYDEAGRVTKKTEFAALITLSNYDYNWESELNTWAASNASGARITRNFYSSRGDLRFTVDAEGYVTGNVYDAAGRLYTQSRYATAISVSDSTTTANVDAASKGSSVTNEFRYDRFGRLVDVYDGNGTRHYLGYRSNGTQAWDIVAYGQGADESKVNIGYDAAGRLSWKADHNGNFIVRYFYNGFGQVTEQRDAAGNATTFTYDKAGRVLTQTNPLSGVTTYEYDALGRGAKVTDPRNNASYSYYDRLGRVTLSIDAAGYATETTYTAFGQVYTVTRRMTATTGATSSTPPTITGNSGDATTTFAYDKLGRTTQATDALGNYEQFGYDAFSNRTSVRNKLGGTTTYAYDKRGQVVAETLPTPSYDASGAVQAASVTNKFEYDSRGNRTKLTEAFGLVEQRITTYVYDNANRLTTITGESHRIVTSATAGPTWAAPIEQFYYDGRGNLIEKRDAVGARTLYWYDKLDRVTHTLSPLGTLTRNFYDANGNVTETRVYATLVSLPSDATGTAPAGSGAYRTTQYEYDTLNRLTATLTPNIKVGQYDGTSLSVATQTLATRFYYDAMGNVVKVMNPNGHLTYSYYDKRGRKTIEIDAENYRTDWAYDADGNVSSERRYAAAGATPTSTTTPPSAPSTTANDRVTNFTHDKMGRRLTETRLDVAVHDGAGAHATASAVITYAYNGLGQVTRKTEATGDFIDYAYDVGGRMVSEERTAYTDFLGNTVTPHIDYYYNGLNDLSRTRARGSTGSFDISERVTTYGYLAGGRLFSVTDAEGFIKYYEHDAVGRMLREVYPHDVSYRAFATEFDLEGRVVSQGALNLVSGAWSHTGLDEVQTHYNAFGEVDERGVNGSPAEKFEYDDAGRAVRSNSGDGVWKYFLFDPAGNLSLTVASEGAAIGEGSLVTRDAVLDLWGSTRDNIRTNFVDGVIATLTRYDARNQAIEVREPQREVSATTKYDLVTSRAYNAFGEVKSETDALGNTIDYTFNAMGRLIKIESPTVTVVSEAGASSSVRPTEHRYYDASGRLVANRDANGNLTKRVLLAGTGYNGSEALVRQVITPDSATVTTGYDIHGQARHVTDQVGRVTWNYYDRMGRLAMVINPGGLTEYFAYDGLGQRIKRWNNQYGNSSDTYVERSFFDAQGRLVDHYAMGGDRTQYAYAWNGSLTTSGMGTFGGWTQTTTFANGKTLAESTDLFGRSVGTTDLGGHAIGFTYDKAGRLVARANSSTINYTFFNTGRIAAQTNMAGSTGSSSETWVWYRDATHYAYDKVGRLTSQKYVFDGASHVWTNGYYEEVYGPDPDGVEDGFYSMGPPEVVDYIWHEGYWTDSSTYDLKSEQSATYDALGRMATWAETDSGQEASISYSYDANSNIRRSYATFHAVNANGTFATANTTQDYWYRFDALNRVVTVKGTLSGGAIVRGSNGFDLTYNYDGTRATSVSSASSEAYTYDTAGRLAQVNVGGVRRGTFTYDTLGRLTAQSDYESNGTTVAFSRALTYNAKSQITADTTNVKRGSDVFKTISSMDYGSGTSYALGQVLTNSVGNYTNNVFQKTSLTTNTYEWWDSAQLKQIVFDPNTANTTEATTQTTYSITDYGGRVRAWMISISDGAPRTINLEGDMAGQYVRRRVNSTVTSNVASETYYRFAEKLIGTTGNNGTENTNYNSSVADRQAAQSNGPFRNGATTPTVYADFDQSVQQINSYYQGASGGAYTVRQGDTLSGIAANLWGDASLWYMLAEANGLGGDVSLAEGQTLVIPTGAMKNTHNANTFTPYDPNDIIGETSPTVPKQPKPKSQKCGTFGAIFLVVIAVAVAVVTAGAAVAAMSASINTIAAGISVVLGGGSAVVGGATLTASMGAMVAAGAIGGAAGSIVSQGVGVMTGIQEKFSWNAVALAAIGGGIGAGVGASALKGIGGMGGAALRGAASSALTQGIGVATGLQKEFSWAAVAAAGVGAAVGFKVAGRLDGVTSAFVRKLGANTASAIANGATRSLIDGSDFGDNIMAALPDVIGQTIGESLAGGLGRVGMTDVERRYGRGAYQEAQRATGRDYEEDVLVVTGTRRGRNPIEWLWDQVLFGAGAAWGAGENMVQGFGSLLDFGFRDLGGSILYGLGEAADFVLPGDFENPFRPSWDDVVNVWDTAGHITSRAAQGRLGDDIVAAWDEAERRANEPGLSPFDRGRLDPATQTVLGAVAPFAVVKGVRSLGLIAEGANAVRAERAVDAMQAAQQAAQAADEVAGAALAETMLARRVLATEFYQEAGWTEERIASHLQGIDFTQPVDVVTLPKGSIVTQYQLSGRQVGNYFTPYGTPVDTVGFDTAGRVPALFELQNDVTVLRSTAASIPDWSGSGNLFNGGGIQYFAPNNTPFVRVPGQ